MPRPKTSVESKLEDAISSLNKKKVLLRDGKKVICLACSENINYLETKCKQSLKQHIDTKKHILNEKKMKEEKSKQTLITDQSSKDFNYDLVQAFAAADIPLQKLECKQFKDFLGRTMKRNILSPQYLRSKQQLVYNEIIIKIKGIIKCPPSRNTFFTFGNRSLGKPKSPSCLARKSTIMKIL